MRILGIDYGARRVGLALSDPGGRLAVPLDTIARRDDRRLVRELVRLCRAERVERVVVGLPLHLDGSSGDAVERVGRFARRLAEATGLPCDLVDERLTSVEAEERLRAAGVDPRRHPERIDALAAQILLQEALDREGAGR